MKVEKKKLKPVPLSMRGKKRYIAFEFISKGIVGEREAWGSLEDSFFSLFGEKGVAEQRPKLVSFNPKAGRGVLRCSLGHCEATKAGVLLVRLVGEKPVVPRIFSVSGSLKKARWAAE